MAYGRPPKGTHWLWTAALGLFVSVLVVLLVLRLQESGEGGDRPSPQVFVPELPADGYPDPPADGRWDTLPLVEDTYVKVMSEAACVSLSHRGTPEQLRLEMDRIYFHYQTNDREIAAFGSDLGYDDIRAINAAERIAAATESCLTP